MEYFIEGSPLLKFWWLESNIFKEILWYSIKSRSQCKIFIYILKEICFLWKYIIGPLDIIYLQGSHLVHIMMMVLYLFLDITTITFIHFSFFCKFHSNFFNINHYQENIGLHMIHSNIYSKRNFRGFTGFLFLCTWSGPKLFDVAGSWRKNIHR